MCVDSRVRKPVIFVVSPQDALGSRVQNLANISVSISLSLSLSLLTSNLHSWPSQWVGRLKQTRKRKRNNAIIAVNQPAIGSFPSKLQRVPRITTPISMLTCKGPLKHSRLKGPPVLRQAVCWKMNPLILSETDYDRLCRLNRLIHLSALGALPLAAGRVHDD